MQQTRYRIHILPNELELRVNEGSNLMQLLMCRHIFLKADCGGHGRCGKCRVKRIFPGGRHETIEACRCFISEDITIEIPKSSIQPYHIIQKAPIELPKSFLGRVKNSAARDFGIAVDLGTTTLAMYLCNIRQSKVLSSVCVKNPQAVYGDDVMSRIDAVCKKKENLDQLRRLAVSAIETGIKELATTAGIPGDQLTRVVTVGNPVMIHILAGIDPGPIGRQPYKPVFFQARDINANDLGFEQKGLFIRTLPQVSGFIGGDILAAALAADLENQPDGTLLIDLGTNGELLLKGKQGLFATSCATGPAFEGASISCGMQALPGAINSITIRDPGDYPDVTVVAQDNAAAPGPAGICGTGVISAVSQLFQKKMIEPGGAFKKDLDIPMLKRDDSGRLHYEIVPADSSQDALAISISQKDIRSVQLGKAALSCGVKFLLNEAGIEKPEKIIIAGAFGSFINKKDMMVLGMIPKMVYSKVEDVGNAAGAGAVMVLCDDYYLEKSKQISKKIRVVELAGNPDFQNAFIKALRFPDTQHDC